jgi:hypothetical protein
MECACMNKSGDFYIAIVVQFGLIEDELKKTVCRFNIMLIINKCVAVSY